MVIRHNIIKNTGIKDIYSHPTNYIDLEFLSNLFIDEKYNI